MKQTGVRDMIENKWKSPDFLSNMVTESEGSELGYGNVLFPFCVAALGIGLAFVISLIEWIFKRPFFKHIWCRSQLQ